MHHMEPNKMQRKKLDRNYARMLQAILNKPWKQHSTKQLYDLLPTISKTIQVRMIYEAHCWRSKDKFIRDILLWTPTHGHTNVGQPERTYLHQLCADAGHILEDSTGMMTDKDEERENQENLKSRHKFIKDIFIVL